MFAATTQGDMVVKRLKQYAKHYIPSGIALLLTLVAVSLFAADKKAKKTAGTTANMTEEPKVSIEPRIKPSPAAEATEKDGRQSSIRIDTTLVLINVTVTDP